MLNFKKTAAFMMSLLLCISSSAAVTAFASDDDIDLKHEGSENIYVDEDVNAIGDDTDSADLKTSGDFSYSVTVSNTACIEACTSKEKDIVIPDTIDGLKVTDLGGNALGSDYDSSPFETVTLPETIEYISASNPFIYCTKLKAVITDEKNSHYTAVDGVLYSKDMTELVCYPNAKNGDSFTIDKKVKTIGASAFYSSKLKSVVFPSSLETVNHHAFGNCENLASVDFSGTSLQKLDDFCFIGCTKLSDVKLPDTLTNIGGGAFANCSSLTEIEFPLGLLEIGQSAFANTGLTYAVIPDSVQSIEYSAFGYDIADDGTETANPDFIMVGKNGSAASIYATDSDSDYDYANSFIFMTNEDFAKRQELLSLDTVTEGDFEYTIQDGKAAVVNCLSTEDTVTVPDTLGGCPVDSAYMGAFSNCYAKKIILPETVTLIREGTFYGCSFLTELTLPQSVTKIEDNAFGNCQALEKLDLGGAVDLGKELFENCPKLRSITLSGKCKTFSEDEPFLTCNSLTEINIAGEGDGNFASVDGVLYSKDMKSLIAYPASKSNKEFKIPSEVEIIEQSAFGYANFLETVDLSNVKYISEYAFEGCDSLTRVKMSKELTTLCSDAFYNCHNLKSLRFYDKIENIAEYSFGFCHNDNADTENGESTDMAVEGFKVYAEKDSIPYMYAEDFGLTVVSGTIELFGHNVSVIFLIVCGALIFVLILSLIISAAVKKHKKKKEEKAKADAAKKRKAEKEAAEKTDEEKK